MGQRFYLAGHEEQRNTGTMASTNCAAASGAMLADQGTLGIKDPGVAYFRKLTDDTEGGLRMGQVASVLEDDLKIPVRLYDHSDNLKWDKLKRYLNKGWFAVVAGDYDVLPPNLQGADYDGFHAVVYHQRFKTVQRVGDPLMTKWLTWSHELAYQYVKKFDKQTQGGIHACVLEVQYTVLRDGIVEAEVVDAPSRDAKVLTTIKSGKKLVTGGIVKGDKVAGLDKWRRVWVPSAASFGYIHWTQSWS